LRRRIYYIGRKIGKKGKEREREGGNLACRPAPCRRRPRGELSDFRLLFGRKRGKGGEEKGGSGRNRTLIGDPEEVLRFLFASIWEKRRREGKKKKKGAGLDVLALLERTLMSPCRLPAAEKGKRGRPGEIDLGFALHQDSCYEPDDRIGMGGKEKKGEKGGREKRRRSPALI